MLKQEEPQLNQTASLDNSSMAKESFGNDKEHPQEKTLTLKVYPNPITGNNISIEGTNFPGNELVTFTVIDAAGKRMESSMITTDGNGTFRRQMIINNNYRKGMYTIRAESSFASTQLQFVRN